MKTKLFLTAVGLSALSVACTNEDVLVNEGMNQNTDRPVVDVRVNAEFPLESGDTESRKVTGANGSFEWENKTDQLGAVRVDESTLFAVGSQHYSNAKFTIVDQSVETSSSASFTTNNTLSVGSYLFYYPYSSAMTTSNQGVIFNLPLVQDYDNDGNKMLDNDFQISPIVDVAGYEEGTLELPIKMRSIYAYGKLNLVLGETTKINGLGDALTSLEVQKVILRTTDSESFTVSGVIDQVTLASAGSPAEQGRAKAYRGATENAIAANMATQFPWIGVESEKSGKYFAALDTIFAEYNAASYAVSNANNYLTAALTNGTSKALSINYLKEGTANGQTLASGSTLTTRFLIPAAKYSQAMTLEVYTDKGMFSKIIPAGVVAKRGYTVNLADANRTTEDYSNATIEIGSLATPNGLISIVSKNDFLATMKQYSTATSPIDVNVEFLDVKVDADMIAAIPAKVHLVIKSDVTFEGNMTLKNITVADEKTATFNGNITLGEGFAFTGNTVVAGGTVTVDKSITGASSKTTTVTAGTLVLPNNHTSNYASIIDVNGGTLNIGTAPAADTDELTLKLNALTAGTINVNVPVTLVQGITVGDATPNATTTATLNVNADITNNSNTIYAYKTATVNNNAELVLTSNAGTVINNEDADLTVDANAGVVTNNASAIADIKTNTGVVNNFGKLTVEDNEGTEDIKAVIEQKAANAVLYLDSNNAYGKVVLCDDSETQIDSNLANAEIVYIDGALFALNGTKLGKVLYVVSEWDGTLPHKDINDLTVNDAFTLASDGEEPSLFTVPAQLNAIEFKSTAEFNRPVAINQTITWNSDVTFGENATIAGTMNFFGNVEVKGATNTISDGARLEFNGVKELNGNALTATNFALISNNGRLTINANITASGNITVSYGLAVAGQGIAAGSIWNSAIVKASNASNINLDEDKWKGNDVVQSNPI